MTLPTAILNNLNIQGHIKTLHSSFSAIPTIVTYIHRLINIIRILNIFINNKKGRDSRDMLTSRLTLSSPDRFVFESRGNYRCCATL